MDFIMEQWLPMQEGALDVGFCLMSKGDYETLPSVFINHGESQRPEKGESVYATSDMIQNYDRYQYGLVHQVYALEDFRGPSLFSIFDISPGMNMGSGYAMLSLTLDEKPAHPVATMEVMVVNSYSERIDTALKLIEYCIQHMRPQDAIETMPGNNTPLERSNYAEDLRNYVETVAMYDARIAGAQSEVDRRVLEDQKAQFVLKDTEWLESTRWSISGADRRVYRERMSDFYISYAFTADEAEGRKLNALHEKSYSGAIDAQTYATTLDQAISMSLEDE